MEAIFGNLAGNVRDTSFRAPFAYKGTVIGVEVIDGQQSRRKRTKETKKQVDLLTENTLKDLTKLRDQAIEKLLELLQGQKLNTITTIEGKKIPIKNHQVTKKQLQDNFFPPLEDKKGIKKDIIPIFENLEFTKDPSVNEQIIFLFNHYEKIYTETTIHYRREKKRIEVGDDLPPGVIKQVKIYVAQKCKIEVGDKLCGRHGNKGVISIIVPEEDMPYHEDGTRVDIILNPLSIISRMNLGQLLESLLGWAGQKLGHNYAVPIFETLGIESINKELAKANLPEYGLSVLYDGLTGKPFEEKVTCGVIYILKLKHRVSEKMHVRDTGPYSLLEQQPLSGRSRQGGQKVGEMEGWGIISHGMPYTMREFFTIKSDDIEGSQSTRSHLSRKKHA